MKILNFRNISFYLSITVLLTLNACKDEEVIAVPDGETDFATAYAGVWTVNENSSLYGQTAYEIIVEKSNNNTIRMRNFYSLTFDIGTSATVTESSILISQQTVNGQSINGSGSLINNGKTMNLTYTANDGSGPDNCTATATKQ